MRPKAAKRKLALILLSVMLTNSSTSRPEPTPTASDPDPGPPPTTRLSISSPAPTICVVTCDDGTPTSLDLPPSISRAGLRRLSRMLPASTHEQLSRFRLGSMS
uniref:Secreted protein n=1 Tax=Caenorhabditis japonica TaxID=281687 RepID=A0A8R1E6W8_CAEJA